MMILSVCAFFNGGIDQYFYPGNPMPPTFIWSVFLNSLLFFAWYRLDSNELHYPRSALLNIAVTALPIVAIPYYLFRSRWLKRGILPVLGFVGVLIFLSMLMELGQYAVYAVIQR